MSTGPSAAAPALRNRGAERRPTPASRSGDRAASFLGGPSRLAASAQPPCPGCRSRAPRLWRGPVGLAPLPLVARYRQRSRSVADDPPGLRRRNHRGDDAQPVRGTGAGDRLAAAAPARAGLALALCGAAIGLFALGAAAACRPGSGVYLAGGILPVARNVLGMTGIGLIFCLVTGALIAWTGPLAFTAISQFALIANYSWPLTWPARPPGRPGRLDRRHGRLRHRPSRVHHQGPRIRQSGELRPADGQRCRVTQDRRQRESP